MKLNTNLTTICGWLACASAALAADNVFHGPSFYGDAPDAHHAWAIHDANRPQPLIVTPGTTSTQEQAGKPPSDAIVLFDGTDLSKWEADANGSVPTKWVIKDGAMECVPGSGYIRTKEKLGDCQLHVEWAAPVHVQGDSQGRGNSGVFLMGLVEVQVLDNYNNPTYADGLAGSVYGQHAAMANALRPPGQFQSYDIIFRRPLYAADGHLLEQGYVTVIENGVVVQDHALIEGETGHQARTKEIRFPDAGPLKFQDHGNPVRYRNVWYRHLPRRANDGGDDGYLTTEATLAKRAEIAAHIRQDAAGMTSPGQALAQTLRYAESLVYTADEATAKMVEAGLLKYLAEVEALPADKIGAKKDEVKHVRDVCRYLAKWKIVPADYAPKAKVDQAVKDHNWDKR